MVSVLQIFMLSFGDRTKSSILCKSAIFVRTLFNELSAVVR